MNSHSHYDKFRSIKVFLMLCIKSVGLKAELEKCKQEKRQTDADLTAQETSIKQQVRLR